MWQKVWEFAFKATQCYFISQGASKCNYKKYDKNNTYLYLEKFAEQAFNILLFDYIFVALVLIEP